MLWKKADWGKEFIKFGPNFLSSHFDYFTTFFWSFSFTQVRSWKVTLEDSWMSQIVSWAPDFKSRVGEQHPIKITFRIFHAYVAVVPHAGN